MKCQKIEQKESDRFFIHGTEIIYEYIQEDRIVFEFEQGNLVSERIMDSWEYHDFINSDEYKVERRKMFNDNLTTIYYWREPVELEIFGRKRPVEQAETTESDKNTLTQ